uniref:Putative secreted protein n=1 Tax=Anopheles darlingi TaxID=43151 RepID=A0A2M4DK82_ANODA
MAHAGQLAGILAVTLVHRCDGRTRKVQTAYTVLGVEIVTFPNRYRHTTERSVPQPCRSVRGAAFPRARQCLIAGKIVCQKLAKLHQQHIVSGVWLVQIGKQRAGNFSSRGKVATGGGFHPWCPNTIVVQGCKYPLHRVANRTPATPSRFDVVASPVKRTVPGMCLLTRRSHQTALRSSNIQWRRTVAYLLQGLQSEHIVQTLPHYRLRKRIVIGTSVNRLCRRRFVRQTLLVVNPQTVQLSHRYLLRFL